MDSILLSLVWAKIRWGKRAPHPLHPLSDGSDHYLLRRGATDSKDLGLVPNWGYAPLVAPPPRVSPIVKYVFLFRQLQPFENPTFM